MTAVFWLNRLRLQFWNRFYDKQELFKDNWYRHIEKVYIHPRCHPEHSVYHVCIFICIFLLVSDLLPCFSSWMLKMWVVSSRMCSLRTSAKASSRPCISLNLFSSSSPRRWLCRLILSLFSWWRLALRCSRCSSSWERNNSSLPEVKISYLLFKDKTHHTILFMQVYTWVASNFLVAINCRRLYHKKVTLTAMKKKLIAKRL